MLNPRVGRFAAIAVAILAAACLLLSVQGGRWWSFAEVGIGPTSTQRCFGDACTSSGLEWTGGSALWQRAGVAVYVAAMISSLALVAMAGALAAGRRARLGATVVLIAIGTAAVSAAVFVFDRPALFGATADRGLWLYAGGLVLALGAALVTLTRRPS